MASICYAIEMNAELTFSSSAVGITVGHLRYITNRPFYEGVDAGKSIIPVGDNSVIKINLDGLESIATSFQSGQIWQASNGIFKAANALINPKDRFTVLDASDFTGGELATAKGNPPVQGDMFEVVLSASGSESIFYVGINRWFQDFITKGGLGIPSRRVDLSKSGDYGTLSGFNFQIDNSIIAGTDTPIWEVFSDNSVFLTDAIVQVYAVIDDVFFKIWDGRVQNNPRSETDFAFICKSDFKAIHQNFPPETINDNDFPDAVDESRDKPIPVCFGEVEFAKLFNLDGAPIFLTLTTTGGTNFDTANASAYVEGAADPTVTLEATGHSFGTNDADIVGSYLFVTIGDGADTERGIRINANSGTAPSLILELAEPLVGFVLATHGFANRATQKETWSFKIAKIGTNNALSNFSITSFKLKDGIPQVFNYNTNTAQYEDVKHVYDDSVIGTPTTLDILSTNLTKEGELSYAVYVPTIMTNLVIAVGVNATPVIQSGTVADLQDIDRSTDVVVQHTDTIPDPKAIGLTVDVELDISNANNKVDDIWIGADVKFEKVAGGDIGAYRIRYFLEFFDIYDTKITALTHVIEYPDPPGTTGTTPANLMNVLPNEYYKVATSGNGDNGEVSVHGQLLDASFGVIGTGFKLPSDQVAQIKAGTLTGKIEVRILITTAVGIGTSLVKMTLKEIGFWATQKVDLNDNNIYTRLSGEKTTGSNEANTVDNAFRLMLETYDGIKATDIDYTNLFTARDDWFVGRQVMAKKNTFAYLKELAQHTFVALFPTRRGKLGLSAWRDRTDAQHAHNETTIVRGSISNYMLTRLDKLFGNFTVKFSPDIGGRKFFSQYQVKDTNDAAERVNNQFTLFWDRANAAFTKYGVRRELILNLEWFNDRRRWYNPGDAGQVAVDDVDSAAFKFLNEASLWLTRQHQHITYKMDMSATNVLFELCDPVSFRDTIYTNAANIGGHIYLIEYDLKNDQIKFTSILEPDDTIPADFPDV